MGNSMYFFPSQIINEETAIKHHNIFLGVKNLKIQNYIYYTVQIYNNYSLVSV